MGKHRAIVIGIALLAGLRCQAQPTSGWGRFSLFGQLGQSAPDGAASRTFNDMQASLTFRSPTGSDDAAVEYAVDTRGATTDTGTRTNRFSIYDAWIGGHASNGTISARVGQMWLNDLGALGSVGGVLLETRPVSTWGIGRPRVGVFYGLEPKWFEVGYVSSVRKYGGYLAIDGEGARRHILGYVTLRDQGVVERSVVTMTNFIPAGREFLVYQAAEYDLTGPGGAPGGRGLNYFFANARWTPATWFEISGTYHHGRSIDTRTITQDQIDGRPISPSALQGLLFESVGARLTLELLRGIRVWGGWASEKNNQGDAPGARLTADLWASNVFRSGLDVTVSDSRFIRPGGGTSDGWYVLLGRSLGRLAYLTADYSTALSVLRITDSGGVIVETRPRTRRYSLSGIFNVSRVFSILATAERLRDDTSTQTRGLLGLTMRF